MLKKYKTITLIGLVTFLTACSSANKTDLYNWGDSDYINSLYNSMIQEGNPQEALPKLEELSQKGKVAPGLYAQIGYIYHQQGNVAKAQEAFNQEIQRFPESKQYMQFLLNKGKVAEKSTSNSTELKKKGAK